MECTRNVQFPLRRIVIAALGSTMLACGGGGGGGPAPITVSEAPRVVAASVGSDVSATNYHSFVPSFAQLVLTSVASSYLGARVSPLAVDRALAQLVATSARRTAQVVGRVQPAETVIDACPGGGTVSLTANDNNGNGLLDGGDSASVTYANCVPSAGALPINGTFSLRVNRSELRSNGGPTALDFDGTMGNLTEGTLATLNGSFTVVRAECDPDTGICGHQRVSFSDATATHASQSVVLRLDVLTVHGGGENTEISGALGVNAQFYALVPTAGERFVVSAGQPIPQAGRMRMLDAAGDAIEIKGKPGGLMDISFFPSGSTTASDVWSNQAWSTFQ